jgi:hypothetical protein
MRTLDTLIVTPTIAPAQGAILLTGDPIKWVDDWAIAGPSTNDRKKIKAQLLAAHATFWRTLSEAPHDCVAPMRQAFTGIAEILFMADLLTVEILNRELPLFVLEAAIAGHWWHMCSATDTRTEIFPGHFGHVDDWQEMNSRWYGLFAAEIAEWHSKLLEVEVPKPLPEQQIPREPAAPEEATKNRPRRGRPRVTPNQHPEVEPYLVTVSKAATREIIIQDFCSVSGFADDTIFGFWRSGNTERCTSGHARRFEATLKMTPEQFLAALSAKSQQT